RLVARIDEQALAARAWYAPAQPTRREVALLVAAARPLVVEISAEARRVADRLEALRDMHVEARLDGLRRDVHREIDLDARRNVVRRPRRGLGHEGAAPDLRVDQPAAARLTVGARHRGEIEAQRARQRAVGR